MLKLVHIPHSATTTSVVPRQCVAEFPPGGQRLDLPWSKNPKNGGMSRVQ